MNPAPNRYRAGCDSSVKKRPYTDMATTATEPPSHSRGDEEAHEQHHQPGEGLPAADGDGPDGVDHHHGRDEEEDRVEPGQLAAQLGPLGQPGGRGAVQLLGGHGGSRPPAGTRPRAFRVPGGAAGVLAAGVLATGWSAVALAAALCPGLGTADPDLHLPDGFAG